MTRERIELKYLLETVDHSGDCTGDECDYDSEILSREVDVPAEVEQASCAGLLFGS